MLGILYHRFCSITVMSVSNMYIEMGVVIVDPEQWVAFSLKIGV